MNALSYRQIPWQYLPALLTAVLVFFLHIDVPYHDQWDLLPLLDLYYRRQLQLTDLLQAHNGHVLLLPKIIMIAMAAITHWNTFAEVLFSLFCTAVNYVLLKKYLTEFSGRPFTRLQEFMLCSLVFSLTQAQNWLWGWQLQIPLSLSFTLSAFVALLLLPNTLQATLLAAVCATAASLSFAAGTMTWLAALPLLWLRSRIMTGVWLLLAAGCYLAFFQQVADTRSLQTTTHALLGNINLDVLLNLFACLGGLLARGNAMLATAVGALLLLASARMIITQTNTRRRAQIAALLLFSLGSAVMIAYSRMGQEQMMASRYGTLIVPVWSIVFFILVNSNDWHANRYRLKILMLAAIVFTGSSIYSFKDFQQLHHRLQNGALALANPTTDKGKRLLYGINPRSNPQQAQSEVELLRKYRLSFYRHYQTQQDQAP